MARRENMGSCRGGSGQEADGRGMSCLCEQLLTLSTDCAEGDPIGTSLPGGCTISLCLSRVKEGSDFLVSLKGPSVSLLSCRGFSRTLG